MSYLIFWNKTKYAETLVEHFGEGSVICTATEYDTVKKDLNHFNALIVLCELNWSFADVAVSMQDLHGIELVKELRRSHDVTIPVLFVSFYSLNEIFNADREIVTSIGHAFYRLPLVPEEVNDYIRNEFFLNNPDWKLSQLELNDIKSFYCSKEGILSQELHYLNRYLNADVTTSNHEAILNDILNTIRKIHTLFLLDSTTSLLEFKIQFPVLQKTNITEAINYVNRLGNTIQSKYGASIQSHENSRVPAEQLKWRVLLLDDEIGKEHPLVQCMKKKGLEVICAGNASDAFAILKNDWATTNTIMVVIADYRLFEVKEGIKHHQRIQGYQFIKDVASSDHLIRIVAFSGLQRKFLLNSFKHYNIRTEVKSKVDYLSNDHTHQLFCDEIIALGEENKDAIIALPSKCAGFDKYLKDIYITFRLHPDYSRLEHNISFTAKEYICEIRQQINDNIEIKIGGIDNIKSPFAKTKKGDDDAFFKRLQNYLVARRIAIWLHAAQKKGLVTNISARRIAEVLTDQKYTTDAYRQVLSTNLGLSLDDFPANITIEERRWLQYEMGMNVFKDVSFLLPVFYTIGQICKDFIVKNKALSSKIISDGLTLITKYRQHSYHIVVNREFEPVVATATDVRVLFLTINGYVGQQGHDELLQFVSKIRFELLKGAQKIKYLNNLFKYFNAVYSHLSSEKSVLFNPAKTIRIRDEFVNKTNGSINGIFEQVYNMLNSGELPSQSDSADLFMVYACGMDIADRIGPLNNENRIAFFKKLAEEINLLAPSFSRPFYENTKSGMPGKNGGDFEHMEGADYYDYISALEQEFD